MRCGRKPIPAQCLHTFLAGIIYPIFGKYEQAVNEARKAIDLDPDFAITYYLLAWRYQDLNRFEDAGKALRAGEGKVNARTFYWHATTSRL